MNKRERSPTAEATDLKSVQCGFESRRSYFRQGSPIGRGGGLKIHIVWVRIPLLLLKENKMPNSKASEVKRKHKKRREKIRADKQEQIANAKKSTMRELHKNGELPKQYLKKIS